MIVCNGHSVLAMRLVLPPVGRWCAELELDTDAAITGSAALVEDGAGPFAGTVLRSGVVSGVCRAFVVGGTGGLGTILPARSHLGATARAVLQSLLDDAGETLDTARRAAGLARTLPYWTRPAVSAGTALQQLCDELGLRWRVLRTGRVWIGTDTWPALRSGALLLDHDGAAGTYVFAPETLDLEPGVTLQNVRLGRVEYEVQRDGALRATAWSEAA